MPNAIQVNLIPKRLRMSVLLFCVYFVGVKILNSSQLSKFGQSGGKYQDIGSVK